MFVRLPCGIQILVYTTCLYKRRALRTCNGWSTGNMRPSYLTSASNFYTPAFIYNGNKINMDGLLPRPLLSNINELSTKKQTEYRLQLRLAHRHRWY